jgi:hypothetical protein
MKKLILTIAAFAFELGLFAQAVPNGGFENWNSIAYEEPSFWYSGNSRDIPKLGVPSVTKVTGVSGFAVRIQNNMIGSDTSDSYILNTNNPCSDPPNWTGGIPYSQQPTAVTGYYRYNLFGNDSALLIVIFRKNGVHIGDNFILIRGTGTQNTFAPFSYSVTCSGVPDTIIIAAASSNKKSGNGAHNGSFIEFDNLAFAGTTQAILGGDFDNWTSKSYDSPTGWKCWGDGVSKTTSMYSGSFAARLETMNRMCNNSGNIGSSGITTGYMSNFNGPRGGLPYTNTKDTVCGYYKYIPTGSDTAGINVSLSKNGSNVAGNYHQLLAAISYTYFEVTFQSGITPDTMRVDIQSSRWQATPANVGSVLYVDNLYLKSSSMGIFSHNKMLQNTLYPNPVKDVLFVRLEKNINATANVEVFDAAGRKIEINKFASGTNSVRADVSNLQPGIYYLEITTSEGVVRNRFIKE